MRALLPLWIAAVALSGCSGSAAAPNAPAAQVTVVSAALRNVPSAAIAHRPVQLHLTVVLSDGTQDVVTAGARWATSNPDTATVDASGLLTGHAPGSATITADVKGASVSADVRVLADLSGTWEITMPAGDGRWTERTYAEVAQDGASITGVWQWDSGVEIAFSGDTDIDGTLRLTGRDCYSGYTYGYVLFEIRDWMMSFDSATGEFQGSLTHSRSGRYMGGPCSGWILDDRAPTVSTLPVAVEVAGPASSGVF